jgi:hypothetical protein
MATNPTGMISITFFATNRRPGLSLQDPSFRYRCENLAQALQARGWQTRLVHARRLAIRAVGQFAVFHRPALSPRLGWLLWRLRRRGVTLVADFDDLVFDPNLAEFSPAVLNGILPLHKVQRAFAAALRAMERFDVITVSTQPLREHVERLLPGKPVAVVPNAVHHSWLTQTPDAQDNGRRKIITYFPGTRSHDRDFQLIVPVLERVLAQNPQVQLHITGRLRCALQAAPDRLVLNERVAFAEYGPRVQRGWINLAPLEDTPFNRCKSALKVIEAGFWGIPTVCSPEPDAERFSEAGAVIAATQTEWYDKLESLLQPDNYHSATTRLRERVLGLADPAGMADAFLAAVG